MLMLGAIGGALLTRSFRRSQKYVFGASEILTSLMLVYVADLLLDYLGPRALARLQRLQFSDHGGVSMRSPRCRSSSTGPGLHLGAFDHPRGGRGSQPSSSAAPSRVSKSRWWERRRRRRTICGLQRRQARDLDVPDLPVRWQGLPASSRWRDPLAILQPNFSPGYGLHGDHRGVFSAGLNPIGILIAGLFLALTFIGGRAGPDFPSRCRFDLTKVFQGNPVVLRARLRFRSFFTAFAARLIPARGAADAIA